MQTSPGGRLTSYTHGSAGSGRAPCCHSAAACWPACSCRDGDVRQARACDQGKATAGSCVQQQVHKQDSAQHPGSPIRMVCMLAGGTEATGVLYDTSAPGAATRQPAAARRGSAARTPAPAVRVNMAVRVRICLGQGVNKRLLATAGTEEQRRWGGSVQGNEEARCERAAAQSGKTLMCSADGTERRCR